MARQARQISPTDYYHVTMRGNNKEEIFLKEEQKQFFVDLLKKLKAESPVEIATYCLMDNHVHILLKGEINELAAAIKKINIRYAMKFNKDANRIGHVFQDRYKSEVVLDEQYLLQLIRYIHNNPVKAKMIKNPEDYKWSSYNDFVNKNSCVISLKQREFIFSLFSNKPEIFKEFHLEEDYNEYLDTKEEIERNRVETAYALIADFCISNGINDSKEIYKTPEYLRVIIRILLEKTKLSHRKIAKILEINNNIVHKISLKK